MFKKALLLIVLLFLLGRLYYATTDGFALSNITYDLPFEVRREVKQGPEIDAILAQPFFYYAKGCQSYVFLSEDGRYVLKFFKYQRYRPQKWLDYIPGMQSYANSRLHHKKQKLDKLFNGWKTAYEDLPDETGVLYVKLSSRGNLNRTLTFYDKIGLKYEVNLDEMQFLVQKRGDMFTEVLEQKMASDKAEARRLLNGLIDLFLSEYERGYADLDPAIIQNTGVLDGRPIHVDVGQITAVGKDFDWKQDLFDKTYKFRAWLKGKDEELAKELDERLESIIGSQFHQMKFKDN